MKLDTRRLGLVVGLAILAGTGGTVLALRPPSAVAEGAAVTPLPPVSVPDGRAGACYSFYDEPGGRPYLPKAVDAGARWDRFDVRWADVERSDGAWHADTVAAYDRLVDDLDAAGVNMVAILLWTPDWAASRVNRGLGAPSLDGRPPGWYAPEPGRNVLLAPAAVTASSAPPRGLYEEWYDWDAGDGDAGINYWGRFVYEIVERYDDQVKTWEMWNEPEWAYFWTGTSTDYAQLLKVGYLATKSACPDCTVLFGGLHYWMNQSYYRWVLAQLAADPAAAANNHYFDVMSVHLYSRSSSIYDEVVSIRSGMATYGVGDHPIWLTETGVPVWDDAFVDLDPTKYDFAATQDEAGAYVIQSYANGWAAGVERYFFFRTNDEDMGEYFGLLRNDRSYRPTYVAYQVANTYLISPTLVSDQTSGDIRHVTLWGTPRGKVQVVWNRSPEAGTYDLPATLATGTRVNRLGVTQTIGATGGVFSVNLVGATANRPAPNQDDYIIGGEPLLVVEAEMPNEPPTATVHALPPVIYTPTFTVTWEGYDAQTGVWRYDVQKRAGAGGAWTGLLSGTTATSTQVTGVHDETIYFRARAMDRLGNRGVWPATAQASTTLDLESTVYFTVETFFADEDRDGVWDKPITASHEVTLTQVTVRLLNGGQNVIPPVVGSSAGFSATVYVGQSYRLVAASTELSAGEDYVHERTLPFTWSQSNQVYTETYQALGLRKTWKARLPLVMRDG